MVTVIADNEALPTPAHNGVTAGSNDNEKHFQYIKEFQEVIFNHSLINMYFIILFALYFRLIFIDHHLVNHYLKI